MSPTSVMTTETAAAKIGRSMKKCERRMAGAAQRPPLGASSGSPLEAGEPPAGLLVLDEPPGVPVAPGSDSVLSSPSETPVGNAVTSAAIGDTRRPGRAAWWGI